MQRSAYKLLKTVQSILILHLLLSMDISIKIAAGDAPSRETLLGLS